MKYKDTAAVVHFLHFSKEDEIIGDALQGHICGI